MKHLGWIILLIVLVTCTVLLIPWQSLKYNAKELQVIRELKTKIHNPKSVEIIGIREIHSSQLPTSVLLVISSASAPDLKNKTLYKMSYRAENVYSALRTHTVYVVHTAVICIFFTQEGKIL